MAMTSADDSTTPFGTAGHLALGRASSRAPLPQRRLPGVGAKLAVRNWRCGTGEIDLILEGRGAVVFCEVKTRTSQAFGHPAESVDHRRQGRLRRAAVEWMRGSGHCGTVRFDVVAVLPGRVERLEDAF